MNATAKRTKRTEATAGELLPSSVPKVIRGVRFKDGIAMVPIYCANCGSDGGFVPEAAVLCKQFAFYLCEPCAEKWSPLVDTLCVPDEVVWELAKQEQLEREGRELTPAEIVEALKDEGHYLSKIAKERDRICGR